MDGILIGEANDRGLGCFDDWTTGRSQVAIWVPKKFELEGMTIEQGAKSYVDYLGKICCQWFL